MSDQTNGGAPDGATATPTPVAGTATTTATTTAPVEVANPSKGDWAGMNKAMREQATILATTQTQLAEVAKALAALAPQQTKAEPSKPADAASVSAQLAALEFKLALKDAIGSAGITDRSFAELVEKAAFAEKPADMAAFVAKYAPLAPRAAAAVIAATAAPSPTAPSNTGAATAAPSSGQLPDNPLLWDSATVRKTGLVAWRKALEEFDARTGKGDPLHLLRPQRRPAK
jgi:hypothetical protein